MGRRTAIRGWWHRLRDPFVCRHAVELVTDYVEGQLDETERTRFERHLAGCDACAAYVELMRTTIHLLGERGPSPVPPAARSDLVDLFRKFHSG